MSNRFRRTAAGVGLALSLGLFAAPAAQAGQAAHASKTSGRAVRTASHSAGHGLLAAVWSFIVGNPQDPRPTQGPTVDPNGIS